MEKYVKGMFAKRNEKAPDFVVCSISLKIDEFAKFVKENKNDKGYLNVQVLKSKDKGTLYAVLDTFEPKMTATPAQAKKVAKNDPFQNGNSGDDDIPF